jgi:choline-sulfatase
MVGAKNKPNRRQLMKASVAGAVVLGAAEGVKLLAQPQPVGKAPFKNILIFVTDQDRGIQHFPPNWERANLPGLTRLKRNGLTFENAFTNACMCTPARVTWLTGYFHAQHGAKYTLEQDMPAEAGYPQGEMPLPFPTDGSSLSLPNLATVLDAAGYNVIYKGKWHCSKPAFDEDTDPEYRVFTPADLAQYGFTRWNPPDGGANQDVSEGGGAPGREGCHDERYMYDQGDWEAGEEGVLSFLASEAAQQQPFCLIVSLVNPHDVLAYPKNFGEGGFGYSDEWLNGSVKLPPTVDEKLLTKPAVQSQLLALLAIGMGNLDTREKKLAYINFYANLMIQSDRYLQQVLDALEETALLDDTLIIRTADHGEMGLSHGGMRQKNFNFYEESIRVPLVFSNPKMFRGPRSTRALVSHVDFLPTMASLVDAPPDARANWQGVDYSSLILNPASKPVQDHIVFTFDDFQAGQKSGPYVGVGGPLGLLAAPNRIMSIREARYKLAQYYDPSGELPSEWEMYDLTTDPYEQLNLAHPSAKRTPEQDRQFARLKEKLSVVAWTRLHEL